MSNHYHLVLSTPDENLDAAIRYLQTEVSRTVSDFSGSSAYCFESRYKWSIIYNSSHYLSVLRYVYQNPIRSNTVKRLFEYQWSTLHGTLGYSLLSVPVYLHDLQAEFFVNHQDLLEFEKWTNEVYPDEELHKIRKGLRRFEFQYSKRKVVANMSRCPAKR